MGRDIYIVRHGNTFDKGDTVTRVGARTDLALSVSGRAQADALAAHFTATGIGFTSAMAGPLKRTVETARTILSAQSAPPDLQIGEFLREIDYGPDENQPEQLVIDRIGEAALQAWEQDATPPPGWDVDPDALRQGWRDCLRSLASKDSNGPALIVTSNGIARFARLLATASQTLSPDSDLRLKTGAYGILHVDTAGRIALRCWNRRP